MEQKTIPKKTRKVRSRVKTARELPIFLQTAYGRTDRFVLDKKVASALEALTGKRTLDSKGMKAMRLFGYKPKQVRVDQLVLR